MASEHLLHMAETIIEMRTARDVIFGPGWFADPAWDMLLELYVAQECGRSTQLEAMTQAARVPKSTGHRVAGRLVEAMLVAKGVNRLRRGGVELSLTDEGREKVERLLTTAIKIGARRMAGDYL